MSSMPTSQCTHLHQRAPEWGGGSHECSSRKHISKTPPIKCYEITSTKRITLHPAATFYCTCVDFTAHQQPITLTLPRVTQINYICPLLFLFYDKNKHIPSCVSHYLTIITHSGGCTAKDITVKLPLMIVSNLASLTANTALRCSSHFTSNS